MRDSLWRCTFAQAITKKLPNELRSECKEEESYRATLAVALGTFGGVEQLST